MEKEIIENVRKHWGKISQAKSTPDAMVCLKLQGKKSNNGSIIVLVIEAKTQEGVALAKIPRDPGYTAQIQDEFNAFTNLDKYDFSEDVKVSMPAGAVVVKVAGSDVLIEGACKGFPAVREFTGRQSIEQVYQNVLPWYGNFSAATLSDENTSLEGRLSLLTEFQSKFPDLYKLLNESSVEYYSSLVANVNDLSAPSVFQHGDFNAYNILIQKEGENYSGFAVIDWEDGMDGALPVYDLNHYFICNANLVEQMGSATDKYQKFILSPGWYQDLYIKSVEDYSSKISMDIDLYWSLTPLYFIHMAMAVCSDKRQEGDTAPQWISWANDFIEKFPKLKK